MKEGRGSQRQWRRGGEGQRWQGGGGWRQWRGGGEVEGDKGEEEAEDDENKEEEEEEEADSNNDELYHAEAFTALTCIGEKICLTEVSHLSLEDGIDAELSEFFLKLYNTFSFLSSGGHPEFTLPTPQLWTWTHYFDLYHLPLFSA